MLIMSLSDKELNFFYSIFKSKLAIYPTRTYAVNFLANNLEIAKIVLLNEYKVTQKQASIVLSKFLESLGVPNLPEFGASKMEYSNCYEKLLERTEHFGFSRVEPHN